MELPMLPRHPDRLPLAELIAERRKQRDLSLTVTARAVGRAAEEEGSWSLASRQAIHGYEGGRIPNKDSLRWLDHALGLSVDEVLTAAEEQRANRDLIRAANAGSRSRHAGLPPAPQTLPVIKA